ncbi:MAG: hypothetical protein ACLSAM_12630 [Alistipes onderdonkii]
MLVQTISQYLGSHKRLVVPQLGTFIVKEPGVTLFFGLLKRDDGVLRGLLREAGVGELEAAGEIDRFVFEVRHAAQHGQEFRLDGFGVLRPGPNGTIAFAYEPRPVQSAADAAPGAASVPARTAPPAGDTPSCALAAPRVALDQMNFDPRCRACLPASRRRLPPPTPIDRPPRQHCRPFHLGRRHRRRHRRRRHRFRLSA